MNNTIYIIRHELTIANKENLCIGLKDSPLLDSSINEINKVGKVQAEVGKMFGKKEIKGGDNITIVVPANFTKELIESANIKQLKALNVSF